MATMLLPRGVCEYLVDGSDGLQLRVDVLRLRMQDLEDLVLDFMT